MKDRVLRNLKQKRISPRLIFWGVIIIGFAFSFFMIFADEIPFYEKITLSKEKISILIAGVDDLGLMDTIMIVKIDEPGEEVKVVSLPRDFIIFDENGSHYKINSIYKRALYKGNNKDQAMKILGNHITNITGLEIDNYVLIDFQLFKDLIDELKGVTIELNQPLYDRNSEIIKHKGIQTLDGETALFYTRDRYSPRGGDLGRSRRQQQVVKAMAQEIISLNLIQDSGRIVKIVTLLHKHSFTDLSFVAMIDLYQKNKQINKYDIYTLVIGNDLRQGPLREGYRMAGSYREYTLEPKAGPENYLQIREEINNLSNFKRFQTEVQSLEKDTIVDDLTALVDDEFNDDSCTISKKSLAIFPIYH